MSHFSDDWKKARDAKRLERDILQFERSMQSPIARGEVFRLGEVQVQHLASLALAVEALEDILVGCGVLEPDELMSVMKSMADQKREIAEAAQAVAEQKPQVICSV